MKTSRSLPCYAVLDGGSASDLVSLGHPEIDDDPLWSARILHTNLDSIRKVHQRFLEAGADIIETVTYQASLSGFSQHLGLQKQDALDLMTTGVKVAREVRDQFWDDHPNLHSDRIHPLVAGSVGPYGACQADGSEYSGSYVDHISHQDLKAWHRDRIEVLLAGGVDVLVLETIPAQKEAEALCELMQDFPDSKAWLSFSCKDGEHVCHGEKIADAARCVVNSDQMLGVGINCTHPKHIESLIKCVTPVLDGKTLIVAPNSGETWTQEKRWQDKTSVKPIHEFVDLWLHLGAHWVGGCCRVTPDDIFNIRTAMSSVLSKPR